MRQTIRSAAIYLLISQAGIAAARDPRPTGVDVELSYSPESGCRAALTRSIDKAPFWEQKARVYALPKSQQRLVKALRRSGRDRYSANIHAKPTVPKTCSGYAFDASRIAAFKRIAFDFPMGSDDGRPAERRSVCEVSADPIRFRGDRIELHGAASTFMNPDAVNVYLREEEGLCGPGAIRLIPGRAVLELSGDPMHPVEMIVTGTPGSTSCFYNPPGTQCGTYFLVESFRRTEQLVR
jgi:hypothetical protein